MNIIFSTTIVIESSERSTKLKLSAHKKSRFTLCTFLALSCICLTPYRANAEPPAPSQDPIESALREIEAADWNHRWTGYAIALTGSAVGMGMGAWGLYQAPLGKSGSPDPVVFASSLLLVGTATTQIVHGGMRVDERVLGAKDARRLLSNETARKASGLFFLRNRAESARSTRLWGGILTTVQGLATTALGVRLWEKADGGLQTAGIVFTGMGVVNTAIGAVHFPGKPRSGRVLDRTLRTLKRSNSASVSIAPSAIPNLNDAWAPGVTAAGSF